MGNFPKRSESHEQEERARDALRACVPSRLFLYRGSETNDYGRDFSLELKDGQDMLNIRVQGQLKSLLVTHRMKDRNVSYRIKIGTLTYLRNHVPGAVWVVYLDDERQLLWEWVDVIAKAIESNHEPLEEMDASKTANYHFSRQLDVSAFEEIYRTAYAGSTEVRRIGSLLRNRTTPLGVVLAETGRVQTSDDAVIAIKTRAIALANLGQFSTVREWFALVPHGYGPEDPEFQVAIGYTSFQSGNFTEAWDFLGQVSPTDVSEHLRDIVEFMQLSLRYVFNYLSLNDYREQLQALESRTAFSPLGQLLELDRLKNKFVELQWSLEPAEDPDTIAEQVEELAQHIWKKKIHPSIKTMAKLIAADVAVQRGVRKLGLLWLQVRHPDPVRRIAPQAAAGQIEESINDWSQRFDEILQDEEVPLRYRERSRLDFVRSRLIFGSNLTALGWPWLTPEQLSLLLQWSDDARQILVRLGDVDQVLNADLIHAEILEAMGRNQEARSLAEQIREKAEGLSLKPLRDQAIRFLSGQTIFGIVKHMQERRLDPADLLNMEAERRQVVVKKLADLANYSIEEADHQLAWETRDIEERAHYCVHLRRVERSPSLRYDALQPARMYYCDYYHYQFPYSIGQNQSQIIDGFKGRFCLGCPQRHGLS